MSTAQYPVLPLAAGTLARVIAVIAAPAVVSFKAFARTMRNRRDAKMLAGLDHRMLADIGITRSDLNDAFSAPLWEDPTALLNERAIERRMNRAIARTVRREGESKAFQRPATGRPATGRPARLTV